MKNRSLFLFVVVALMASLLPVGVLAAAPAEVKVFVHNNTGGDVQLSVTDADGNIQWMTFVAGVSTQMMTEGKYSFYAVTNCGNQAGMWNLNVSKQLFINCDASGASVHLSKQCPNNRYGVVWVDKMSGIHLYAEKDVVNIPDSQYFTNYFYNWFGNNPVWSQVSDVCFSDFARGRSVIYWGDSVYWDENEWFN